jgi:hypothetical protein
MGEKSTGATFAPKLELFPSVAKETDKVVLWHEHVTKEGKLNDFRNSNARFVVADPRSLANGKMAPVTDKAPMANASHKTKAVKDRNSMELQARGRRKTESMTAAELQAAAWGAQQASARNKSSARHGTWGRKSARTRLSMHLAQRSETLMGELQITDAERRISGLPQTQSYEELPTDFKFDIDDHIRFSQRNDLPDRKKNRGMHNERLSCNGWGPLLETKNGPIPRTESQKLGWHGLRGDDGVSKPLVPARHAMKRLGQRSRLSSCDETKYVADFYQSFGVSLFNPGAKPSAD